MNYKNKLFKEYQAWWIGHDGKEVFGGTFIVAILVFFYYLTLEPLNSDCFATGILKYTNDMAALELGKWVMPYAASMTGHIVIPTIFVCFYVFCVSLSTILLSEMWNIENKAFKVLIGAVLIVAPAVIGQIVYIYHFTVYAIGLLCAVLSSYITVMHRGWKGILKAACVMSISLGAYQPYIGDIAIILVGTCLILIATKKNISFSGMLKVIGCMILFFILGLMIYWLIMKLHLFLLNRELSGYAGINQMSIMKTLKNIPVYFKNTYRIFIAYYRNVKLLGNVFWEIIIITAIFEWIYLTAKLVIRGDWWRFFLGIVIICSLPPCANIIYLVLPEHGMQLHMTFHMQLVAPLCVSFSSYLFEELSAKTGNFYNIIPKMIFFISKMALIGLIACYSCMAYSSFRTLDIGNRHVKYYIQNTLTHVLEDNRYVVGMPIVFIGFVDDKDVQQWNPLREYSYFDRSIVFWKDRYEIQSVWRPYCWYNFGVDIGEVTTKEYDNILSSEEFKEMEQYPSNKSYAIIDGCYVVLLDRDSVAE